MKENARRQIIEEGERAKKPSQCRNKNVNNTLYHYFLPPNNENAKLNKYLRIEQTARVPNITTRI